MWATCRCRVLPACALRVWSAEAATAINHALVSAHYLNHPQVSVVVEQYATLNVTIIGEVRAPGAYPIATPRPILDVIALGGGLDTVADRNFLWNGRETRVVPSVRSE